MTYGACLPSLEKIVFGPDLFKVLAFIKDCRQQGFEATLMATPSEEDLKWYAADRIADALR